MLTVYYKNGSASLIYQNDFISNGMDVTYLEANGEELDLIHSWGYPNHNKRHETYVGDTAIQIALNW